ncbi:hypothetical protein DSO57_1001207 [Entomophthora muscae]|uniref:Uncharacterized protein n=1 Tax=Entomophthora muscae TaxID=34485 RepID=A0ACC2TWH5_9FUNG|nr:hypothetical protein DSO57_1001207 [Entomophthora muscae]
MNPSLWTTLASLLGVGLPIGPTEAVSSAVMKSKLGTVEWDVTCRAEEETCTKVNHALELMSSAMENALALKPIRIQLGFENTCSSWFLCSTGKLSTCKASTLIHSGEGKQSCIYPPALYKQKHHDQQVFPDYDMFIKINAQHRYYFPSDYPSTQEACQYDFMYILTHQVLYGLGISSSYFNLIPSFYKPARYQSKYNLWFTKFDKHIKIPPKDIGLIDYARDSANQEAMPQNNVSSHRHSDYTPFTSLAQLSKHGLYFKTSTNRRISLKPSLPDAKLSPTHILPNMYENTRDESLVTEIQPAVAIHDLFSSQEQWITSPFGPGTLDILATLGYTINPTPQYNNSMESYYLKDATFPLNRDKAPRFAFSIAKYFCWL